MTYGQSVLFLTPPILYNTTTGKRILQLWRMSGLRMSDESKIPELKQKRTYVENVIRMSVLVALASAIFTAVTFYKPADDDEKAKNIERSKIGLGVLIVSVVVCLCSFGFRQTITSELADLQPALEPTSTVKEPVTEYHEYGNNPL